MPRRLGSMRDRNQLTGSIPDLSSLSKLRYLGLKDNRLSGTVPDWLGTLPRLDELYLGGNELTGCLPASLESLSTDCTDIGEMGLRFCEKGQTSAGQ